MQLRESLGNSIGRALRLDEKVMIMCGMSAAFSALFGTPMAAAIFSMEVVSVGIMYYSVLVPYVVVSLIAHGTALEYGIAPEGVCNSENSRIPYAYSFYHIHSCSFLRACECFVLCNATADRAFLS